MDHRVALAFEDGVVTVGRVAGSHAISIDDPRLSHAHASFCLGVLHGVAGSSHFFGVLPALALPMRIGLAAC